MDMAEQLPSKEQENATPDFEFSGEISSTALVRVLIKKGIVTSDELINEERERRDSIFSTIRTRDRDRTEHEDHIHHSRLKNWASKKRWRRRITGLLLGWKWKKVRHAKNEDES